MATKTIRQVAKEIFNKIDVRKVLDYYGVQYTPKGDELVMHCPFHPKLRGKEDKNPSFSINANKKLYACWSCPAKGNIYQLVMRLELDAGAKSCDYATALKIICEINNISVDGVFRVDKDSFNDDLSIDDIFDNEPVVQEVFNDSVLNKFYLKKHNYFLDRGFKPETLKTFEMGFGTKGLDKDRCIFPVRNIECGLVGWTGRAVLNTMKPKWLHRPKDRFYTTLNLFNIDKALKYILDTGDVYVVESVGNCMRLWECGYRNVVAVLGSKMSEVQASMLCDYANRIYLLYDNDDAGYDGNLIAINLLYDKDVEVFVGEYDFGKNKKGNAYDIADANSDMIDTIVYISMEEYIRKRGGLMKILDEINIDEPVEVHTPEGVSVFLVNKVNKKETECPQLCMDDIVYIRRIHNMFGINAMTITPEKPF